MSDLIYRQDAIDLIRSMESDATSHGISPRLTPSYVTDGIESLPSADRPTGEWVVKDGEMVCSLCGNSVSFSRTEDGWVLGKFCQTCGAKMRGEDSE